MPAVESAPTIETPRVDALASFRSEIDALPQTEVLTPRVDVAAAALIAIGAMPEIEAQRSAVVAMFGDAGARLLDRLMPIAQALMLANARLITIAERDLEPMARELMDMRTRLFTAASALMERGLVNKKSLGPLAGGQSYQARVTDTIALVEWFHSQPAAVRAYTTIDEAALTHALELADAFAKAFAERDQARAGSSRQGRDRARVFTLFFQTYDRVRQLITYLRWHEGDVDKIAPSLFAGRGSRKHDADLPPDAPIPDVPPGMPGGDPFRTTT
jgi:hypothetical protein